MASPLFDMLSDLAKDADALSRFQNSPSEVMEEYGIDAETQALLVSSVQDGMHQNFFKAIGDEAAERFGGRHQKVLFC